MIDQQEHFRALVGDLTAFRQYERQAVELLARLVDDAEAFAGADAAHDVIVGAVRDTANELGKTYYE